LLAGPRGPVELPPTQRRLDEFQLEQLRIRWPAEHVDARIQQLGLGDPEVRGRRGQRRVADVPQLEVRVGGSQRLLRVAAGVVGRIGPFVNACDCLPLRKTNAVSPSCTRAS
jgi:hypothetical protein